MDISSLALSTIFRKISPELIAELLRNEVVLSTMNHYTIERYNGEVFWYGGFDFNPNFRIVCPPTAWDFIKVYPFFCKTVFLERVPFTEGENYAKFGINWRLDKPLLVK